MLKFVNTFDKHRKEPDRSLSDYTKSVKLQLGHELQNITKIYLDTNIWIHLREVSLGRNKKKIYIKLFDLLKSGVQKHKLICPISDEIFAEILLQTNQENLIASAKVIDELSEGISVLSSREREQYEILYFIYRTTNFAKSLHDQEVFVWSKVSFTYGLTHPHLKQLPPEEELVIQKSFFDQMWSITFSEMVDVLGHENILSWPRHRDISEKLTDGKFEHMKENQSFKELHLEEIAGVLDIYKPLFAEAMRYIFESNYNEKPKQLKQGEIEKFDCGQMFANIVYHGFEKNKLGTYLPSLIIESGLHAMVRYDKERKFKKNDLPDFRHAKSALPYFDVFLTERSMHHLIRSGKLAFDKKYSCKVFSDPVESVGYIEKIIS
jgi:predicted nucleic acid-binding protein